MHRKNLEANIDLEVRITPGSEYLGIALKNGINEIPLKKSKLKVMGIKITKYGFYINLILLSIIGNV